MRDQTSKRRHAKISKNSASAELNSKARRATGARTAAKASEKAPREVHVPELFQILVSCGGEDEQRSLYERLTAEGYECRLVAL